MTHEHSLFRTQKHHWEIPFFWFLSAGLLCFGLTLPVIKFTELLVRTNTYSILTGIQVLWQAKDYFLAGLLFLFSVIFPIIKLGGLAILWFYPLPSGDRKSWIDYLGNLAKWSMLDVYVVALTIVIAKSSALIKAEPKSGIYVFAGSILCSIIVSHMIGRLAKKDSPRS